MSKDQGHTAPAAAGRHKIIGQYKELTEEEEKILDVVVFWDLKYFLTATSEGKILVWKFMRDEKLQTTKKLMHVFEGHFKAVTGLN